MTTQGERIKELAAAKGKTIAQLARDANIDESAMVNIVGDKIGLGPVRARRIADALDLDVSDVLLPKAEAVTLASLDRRLQELAGEVAKATILMEEALQLLRATPRRAARGGQSRPREASG